ncbi:glycosyltransferase family 4 protein [Pyrococcus kukulkanii]|uniref:glycosyltransferase family 4 protein n=1 Tax=Pyrococcus kukulkanii TaxID=1609559 RepID=UPI00356281E2
MKIAFIYDAVYPWIKGGAQKRIYEIAKRLVNNGHEVHWFGLNWWNGNTTIEHDGVYIHGVGKSVPLYKNGRRSISEALYFARKLILPLSKDNYDIIDCQEFPYFSCFSTKLVSIAKHIPMVITWYEVWGDYWFEYLGRKGIFGKFVEKYSTKLPHLIIPISEKIKSDLEVLGVPKEKMRVVPNGVDFYRIQNVKPHGEEFDIVYVGRLISHKNVDVLLKAVTFIREEIKDVRVAIIGDGPERDNLIKLSKELNLQQNVKFFGFLEKDEDVYAVMKASKVFVLPSTREGFPNTILEANSCGLPAIVIDHPLNGSTGIVKNGYNGFILPLSEKEISTRVLTLLQDSNLLNTLKRNSIEFAKSHDWSVIVKKLENVYKGVGK